MFYLVKIFTSYLEESSIYEAEFETNILDFEFCVLHLEETLPNRSLTSTTDITWRAIVKAIFAGNLLKVAIWLKAVENMILSIWLSDNSLSFKSKILQG